MEESEQNKQTGHGWYSRQVVKINEYKQALEEIAYTTNLTGTPEQFANYLQGLAREVLNANES